MANKLKKSTPKVAAEKPEKSEKAEKPKKGAKPSAQKLKNDRQEKLDLKKLARDERTWKIIGTVSLLVSIFLFIAFISYLFTWQEDNSQVRKGVSFLFDTAKDNHVSNLLGRLGAYVSYGLINNGFGLASFLFCTFFFVLGVNLVFGKKVFSISRNLKYVTFGLVIASTTLGFIFPAHAASFYWGGAVGDMISNWLIGFLGMIGTAALLLVVGISYLIWQFNPSFQVPEWKLRTASAEAATEQEDEEEPVPTGATINDLYASGELSEKRNLLKGEGAMIINMNDREEDHGLTMMEKEKE